MRRCLTTGSIIWLGATIGLRLGGQYILRPENLVAVGALLAASFPLVAVLRKKSGTLTQRSLSDCTRGEVRSRPSEGQLRLVGRIDAPAPELTSDFV